MSKTDFAIFHAYIIHFYCRKENQFGFSRYVFQYQNKGESNNKLVVKKLEAKGPIKRNNIRDKFTDCLRKYRRNTI